MAWWRIRNSADAEEAELRIEGDITLEPDLFDLLFGLYSADKAGLVRQIREIGNRDLIVWIDSPGGDLIAGAGIYTALCEHREKTGRTVTVKVLSAMSAAHMISMAGDKVLYSPVGIGMMHNPSTEVQGEVKDLEKAIDVLDKCKDIIVTAYCRKTGKSAAEISEMMDRETWMTAEQAVEMGFADGILYDDADKPESITDYMAGAQRVYNRASHRQDTGLLLSLLNQREALDSAYKMLNLEEIRYGGKNG